jgi:hypothetical protein
MWKKSFEVKYVCLKAKIFEIRVQHLNPKTAGISHPQKHAISMDRSVDFKTETRLHKIPKQRYITIHPHLPYCSWWQFCLMAALN